MVEQISLFRITVARRIDDLSKNIEVSLKERINKCSVFSTFALDQRFSNCVPRNTGVP